MPQSTLVAQSQGDLAIRARNLRVDEWHKLIRMKSGLTCLISIPGSVLFEVGVDPEDELGAKWAVVEAKLRLKVQHQTNASKTERWHKLPRVSGCITRLISIPAAILWEMKFHPAKELIGKWIIQKKNLFLEVQYRNPNDKEFKGKYIVRSNGRSIDRANPIKRLTDQ